jgi:5-methylthioadenosine/S-adenosylhomocysteine deaminase
MRASAYDKSHFSAAFLWVARAGSAGGPPNLVYAGSGHEVKTVMVAGNVLLQDGEVLVSDEAAVRAEAQVQSEEVARRVAVDPVHTEMALLTAMNGGML